jgi:hypothetical protein
VRRKRLLSNTWMPGFNGLVGGVTNIIEGENVPLA